MPPRVSVVIATYNRSEVLACAIGSVLRQTFRDFELLVVGDGCTDDSERVVTSIGDPRVQWINLERNHGHQSAANNEGLHRAQGEFIAYLGHDDLWLPNHLAAHVETHERTDAEVAYSLCMLVASDGTSWPELPRPRSHTYSPPLGMTHRRATTEELGGWRDHRTLVETRDGTPDVELWRRMANAGKRFAFASRLTAIKFPAAWRRDVYRTHDSREQREWLARIDAEPELETRLLVQALAGDHVPSGVPFRELLRHVLQQASSRIRRRFALAGRATGSIEENRKFKGL